MDLGLTKRLNEVKYVEMPKRMFETVYMLHNTVHKMQVKYPKLAL